MQDPFQDPFLIHESLQNADQNINEYQYKYSLSEEFRYDHKNNIKDKEINKKQNFTLSEEFLLNLTQEEKLENIKILNLYNFNINDISLLKKCKNIRILNLASNQIEYIEPLSELKRLKELYLNKNNISDLNQIDFLEKIKSLEILDIRDNKIFEKGQQIISDKLFFIKIIKKLGDLVCEEKTAKKEAKPKFEKKKKYLEVENKDKEIIIKEKVKNNKHEIISIFLLMKKLSVSDLLILKEECYLLKKKKNMNKKIFK